MNRKLRSPLQLFDVVRFHSLHPDQVVLYRLAVTTQGDHVPQLCSPLKFSSLECFLMTTVSKAIYSVLDSAHPLYHQGRSTTQTPHYQLLHLKVPTNSAFHDIDRHSHSC